MLRNILTVAACFAMLASIPVVSYAEPVAVTDGILKIPTGGMIAFPDGTSLNSSSRLEGGLLANAQIVTCFDKNECFCGAGQVIKAVLSYNCRTGHVVQSEGIANPEATGWGVWCAELVVEKQLTQVPPIYEYVSQVYYRYTTPTDIYLACTTP